MSHRGGFEVRGLCCSRLFAFARKVALVGGRSFQHRRGMSDVCILLTCEDANIKFFERILRRLLMRCPIQASLATPRHFPEGPHNPTGNNVMERTFLLDVETSFLAWLS
jgi:hypothetical protein